MRDPVITPRDVCERLGISLASFGRILGIPEYYVNMYQRNEHVPYKAHTKIYNALQEIEIGWKRKRII